MIRYFPDDLTQYCDEIVSGLMANIQESEVDRSVKPVSLSCLGDIALSLQDKFLRYLAPVLNLLDLATQSLLETQITEDIDFELIEYVSSS